MNLLLDNSASKNNICDVITLIEKKNKYKYEDSEIFWCNTAILSLFIWKL